MTDISNRKAAHAPAEESPATDLEVLRDHLLARIRAAPAGHDPFRHLYIEDLFPDRFYEALRAHMLAAKSERRTEDRHQDNPRFKTGRFNLVDCDEAVISTFRAAFADPEVMTAVMARFFLDPRPIVGDGLTIHNEFEYTFTRAGRFQNIHVDIPPKYLSFVFYIPERATGDEAEELANATILYDENLQPRRCARFRRNSVCIFAPHYTTYHGFASTMDRDVLVMFYVHPGELAAWRAMRLSRGDEAPFTGVRDLIEDKLRRHPLIEFGQDDAALRGAREACRINAPQGRVLPDPA